MSDKDLAGEVPGARAVRRERRVLTGGMLALLVLAAWLYFPRPETPFSSLDFSEFLPILKSSRGLLDSFRSLASYYAAQGRTNLVPYAELALDWRLFGMSPAGWYMVNWLVCAAVVVVLVLFLRRLSLSASATLAGGAMYVVGIPAIGAWMRITGEPLALLALLAAAHLALGYATARRWTLSAAGIVVACALVALSKEPVAVLVPIVLVLPFVREPFHWGRRYLVLWCGVSIALCAIGLLVLSNSSEASAAAYVRLYAHAAPSAGEVLLRGVPLVVPPFQAHDPALAPATFSLAAVMAVGLWSRARPARRRTARIGAMGLALSTLPLGLLAYAPWPLWSAYYAYAFIVGMAVLLALAVDSLERQAPALRLAARMACALAIAWTALWAYGPARHVEAQRRVEGRIARRLAGSCTPSLLVGQSELPPPGYEWSGRAQMLAHYAAAVTGSSAAHASDVPCDRFERLWSRPPEGVLLLDVGDCHVERPQTSIMEPYGVFDFGRTGFITSVEVAGFQWNADQAAVCGGTGGSAGR